MEWRRGRRLAADAPRLNETGCRNAARRPTMKKTLNVLAVAGVVLGLAGGSARAEQKDIVDTAVAAGSFSTLAKALDAAGLVATLKGAGPFTVFAPTDEAFAKLPAGVLEDLLRPENKAKLQAILTYHVVPGKVMASQVTGLTSAKTVNGKSLRIAVKDGKVMIDDAHVVQTDIVTSNGVIHVIDSVVLPPAK
jgi:uncharacterized surface protein with fasciclin (FAS1) repeats